EELKNEYEDITDNDHVKSEIAVGLAYLCFEFLRSLGLWVKWRDPDKPPVPCAPEHKAEKILEQAIIYSTRAFSILEDLDTFKAMYTLNQRLYFLVEAGAQEKIDEMEKLAHELLIEKDRNPHYWQYTYNDTLARFHHRLALFENDESH